MLLRTRATGLERGKGMTDVEIDLLFHQAVQHLRAGALDQAETICRNVLAYRPDDYGASHLLALCLEQGGRLAEAATAYSRAILASPDNPVPHLHLGKLCAALHQPENALSAVDRALALNPHWPDALILRARVLAGLHRQAEALTAFRRAVMAAPADIQMLTELGLAAQSAGELDEALAAFQRAAALEPENAAVLSNLGNHLHQHMGRPREALLIHRKALAAAPGNAVIRYNHALTCLSLGLFADGWRDYEWRWQASPAGLRRRDFVQPQWDGAGLEGRVILLHAEQGYGDCIQFLRFAERVRYRGGRVVVQTRAALAPLVADVAGVERVVTPDQDAGPIDTHLPLMSLPRVLGLTCESDLAMVQPYLHAPSGKAAAWRGRMTGGVGRLRVGIVWAGDPKHGGDHLRSISPASMAAALSGVAGRAALFGLQKSERHDGAPAACGIPGLIDLGPGLEDFADTAAAIMALDLVITVDTAVAHLAGALGKPVWVLLPLAPDWRWQQERSDSPWYPTMRLFRQRQHGEWRSVLEDVRAALAGEVSADTIP